jgi:hypothetical protein
MARNGQHKGKERGKMTGGGQQRDRFLTSQFLYSVELACRMGNAPQIAQWRTQYEYQQLLKSGAPKAARKR